MWRSKVGLLNQTGFLNGSRLVEQYMEGLHIKQHANKYTRACSGGTNRKLSYAMAMLGNPKIVLLDEPRKEEFICWQCTFWLNKTFDPQAKQKFEGVGWLTGLFWPVTPKNSLIIKDLW